MGTVFSPVEFYIWNINYTSQFISTYLLLKKKLRNLHLSKDSIGIKYLRRVLYTVLLKY